MTVRELIKHLMNFPMDSEVFVPRIDAAGAFLPTSVVRTHPSDTERDHIIISGK